MGDAGIDSTGTVFNRFLQVVRYADDLHIIGRFLRIVTEAFLAFVGPARRLRLIINEIKTKYMVTGHEAREGERIENGIYTFEKVNNFVYLGCQVNSGGETTERCV